MDLSGLSSNLPTPGNGSQNTVLDPLGNEISTEFKNAAKLVASLYASKSKKLSKAEFTSAAKLVAALYRLTIAGNTQLRERGYLDCLDDILLVMTSGGDIENWILTRRAEILNANPQLEATNASVALKTQGGPPSTLMRPLHDAVAEKTASLTAPTPSLPPLSATVATLSLFSSPVPPLLPGVIESDYGLPSDMDFLFTHDLSPPHHFRPLFPPLLVLHLLKQRQRLRRELQMSQKLRPLALLDLSEDSDCDRPDKRRKLDM